MNCELHQVITRDGLWLDGLFFKPRRRGHAAAIWLGGLTSRVTNNPTRTHAIARALGRMGVALAVFDHRGLGLINVVKKGRAKKQKSVRVGTALERFEDCIYDIDAVRKFLWQNGYRYVFLLGHSTGANKAAYYIWKRRTPWVKGVALVAPLSDIPIIKRDLGTKFLRAMRLARTMISQRKGDSLMPRDLVNNFWTANRFLSIAQPGRREDTFPYYDPSRKFYWTQGLKTPVLVVIGGQDQYAARPISEIMSAFARNVPSQLLLTFIIQEADHGFTNTEPELASCIARWSHIVEKGV